jgi:two-component system, OmpR family, sensor kinase
MSLRLRLVAALGALLTVGLVAFGVGTYKRYSDSEYQRLDARLRQSIPGAGHELSDRASIGGTARPSGDGGRGQGPDGGPASRNGPSGFAAPASYSELRDQSGASVVHIPTDISSGSPKLSDKVAALSGPITVGSATGSGSWRVFAASSPDQPGYLVIVAEPLGRIASSLRDLLVTDLIAGLALLGALAAGSWLILRRGLRPLENMAVSARSISAGDLSQRVSPADSRSEVGQLGVALNSMLGEIETAFQEREATEARLRQFLTDASHELRTPLTSIQGFAELFRVGTNNEHIDQGVIMRRIEEESARMKVLVEDLLLLARLDQPRTLQPTALDLTVLAADACSDAVAADPTRPITLDAPDPVVIDGIEDHLRQAVANLVTNALRHTPAGTPIEVGARLQGSTAVLVVRDHGDGLDDEALVHVFDRFWQADRARVGTGVGLGLSIVAGIAHEHGGIARAANDPAGGAVFSIEVPVRRS